MERMIKMKNSHILNTKKHSDEKIVTFNGSKLILGDCLDELKTIPDRSVDLIVLDPPYWKVISEHWDFQWRTESDYAKWCFQWFSELSRVIRLGGSLYLFGFLRNLIYLYKDILESGFVFRQEIIVDKGIKVIGDMATKGYKMFPNVVESVWFFIFDSKPFIKQMLLKRQKELNLSALEINKRLGVTSINSEITIRNCLILPDMETINLEGGYNPPLENYGKGIQIWNLYGNPDIAPLIQNCEISNADIGIYLYSQAFGGAILG